MSPEGPAQGSTAVASPPVERRRRWRRVRRGVLVVVVLVLLALLGAQVYLEENPYYAIAPGDSVPVAPLVSVEGHALHRPRKGGIYLTDVELGPIGALNLPGDLLDPHVELVPARDVLGSTPSSQYDAQNYVFMSDSKEEAEVAALRALGYSVQPLEHGVLVVGILHGSPALGRLKIGDVIVAADGKPTPDIQALLGAIGHLPPGRVVRLTVKRLTSAQHLSKAAPLDVGRTTLHVDVRLAKAPASAHTSDGVLDVLVQDDVTYRLPFTIHINSEGIGGPSAGLAFTLDLIDELSNGDLTGGLRVAATGTMSPSGHVGTVGGLAQKTIAVRRAGATLFLVPPKNFAKAEANAGPHLKVVAVSSLRQALEVLGRYGGDLSGIPLVHHASASG